MNKGAIEKLRNELRPGSVSCQDKKKMDVL